MSRTYRYTYDLKYADGKWNIENWSLEERKTVDAQEKKIGSAPSTTVKPTATIQMTANIGPSATNRPTQTPRPSAAGTTTPPFTAKGTPGYKSATPKPTGTSTRTPTTSSWTPTLSPSPSSTPTRRPEPPTLSPTPTRTPSPTRTPEMTTPPPTPESLRTPSPDETREDDIARHCPFCGYDAGTIHVVLHYKETVDVSLTCPQCGKYSSGTVTWN